MNTATPTPQPDPRFNTGLAEPRQIAHLTGLQMLEAMKAGDLPMPPFTDILPNWPHDAGEGWIEFRARPMAKFSNPMGSVHGGWAMTMLDTAMGCACHTTLAAGETYASLDTHVKFTRPLLETVGEVRITGRVISRGRRIVTVDGELRDLQGKLYAQGTSSCIVSRLQGASA